MNYIDGQYKCKHSTSPHPHPPVAAPVRLCKLEKSSYPRRHGEHAAKQIPWGSEKSTIVRRSVVPDFRRVAVVETSLGGDQGNPDKGDSS
jgi:hypothetical protein